MNKSLAPLCLLLILTACVSKPDIPRINYYLLDSAPINTASQKSASKVAIAPVVVADYLDLPNLVLKQSDHRITVANFHLWAEPLSNSSRRVLINELNARGLPFNVVAACSACMSVSVDIEHFYPEEKGDAVLSGRYNITHVNGDVDDRVFILREPLSADGYTAAVNDMRLLLSGLSTLIAADLQTAVEP